MTRALPALVLVFLLLTHSTIAAASDSTGASKEESSTSINTKNWAHRATAYGFVFTSIFQPLGFASDGARACGSGVGGGGPNWCMQFPPLVISTAVILLISPPIVAAGAASARIDPRVKGFPGARKAGWVLYGIAAAMCIPFTTIALLPWTGPQFSGLPVGLMTGMTVLGALSGMLLSIDGMESARQLKVLQEELTPEEISTMNVAPFLSPISGGAIAGIGGTF